MVISFPAKSSVSQILTFGNRRLEAHGVHFMIENLGLSRLGLGDEGIVQHIEDILADFLEFGLDFLTVVTDSTDMLV